MKHLTFALLSILILSILAVWRVLTLPHPLHVLIGAVILFACTVGITLGVREVVVLRRLEECWRDEAIRLKVRYEWPSVVRACLTMGDPDPPTREDTSDTRRGHTRPALRMPPLHTQN